MARSKESTRMVTAAVQELVEAVTALVESVSAAAAKTSKVVREVRASRAQKSKKLRSALKSYWGSLKGKAREERIRVMLAGRGLVPGVKGKAKGKTGKKGKKGRKGKKKRG